MISFAPHFKGTVKVKSPIATFLDHFRQRVEAGLFTGRPHWRVRYHIIEFSSDRLSFAASTFMSAINVGLNHVTLQKIGPDEIEYDVTYRIWAAYCVGLGAVLALAGSALYFVLDISQLIAQQRIVPDAKLNRALGVLIYWGSFLGWGLVWPWILIALHKSPVRGFLLQIIKDVDSSSS